MPGGEMQRRRALPVRQVRIGSEAKEQRDSYVRRRACSYMKRSRAHIVAVVYIDTTVDLSDQDSAKMLVLDVAVDRLTGERVVERFCKMVKRGTSLVVG
jgi:hypothetical protein